eukprot:CAMPEP_0202866606 /NCGR_PEP_ID=MMETSP1391-20130828/8138_1 /ASSEMBLY_ACC=CAM_ASM_000867 /TAXON_ID=1034604 /ORGANISM="Chlamydomonas leiostraca, Strain SAG 11-49" /LENGTH=208 /DNA_ID=CAMNT_0049546573 /DNA_START=8 /DNA_END=634 /DNA_ORIENTATION=+
MSAPAAAPAAAPTALSSATSAPAVPGALGAIVGRVKEYGATIFKQQKPWSEVLDRNTLSKPANLTEALGRIKKNTAYFRVNYLMVVLTTCVVTFAMHPSSLFILAMLLGGWIYLLFIRTAPVVISGRQLSEREKVLGMSAISFITIFFLTSVGTVFFSALSFSLAVVLAHGAFREPDNLFIDDAESQQGFFNILTGTPAGSTGLASVV